MPNFKPRCSFIGCDPVTGQCLGFCEQLHRVDASQIADNRTLMYAGHIDTPITFAGDEPDDELERQGPPKWLGLLMLVVAVLFIAAGVGAL